MSRVDAKRQCDFNVGNEVVAAGDGLGLVEVFGGGGGEEVVNNCPQVGEMVLILAVGAVTVLLSVGV